MNILKLNSCEEGVKKVCLFSENIESFYEFDDDVNKNKIKALLQYFNSEIMDWAEDIANFLEKSKAKPAKELLERYEEIYDEFIDIIENPKPEMENYRVIKLYTGTLYAVNDSLEEIEDMLLELNQKEKYGI